MAAVISSELGKRGPQIFDSDAAMAKQLQKLMEENYRLKNELSESQEEVMLLDIVLARFHFWPAKRPQTISLMAFYRSRS
jgi:hypothetical protein